MAKPRIPFARLKTADRKAKFYAKPENGGLSRAEVARRYDTGTLGPQSKARGHGGTPEHGLRDAERNRDKYRTYLERQDDKLSPDELRELREQALRHQRRELGDYFKYNDATSELNILGDPDNPDVYPGMTAREARYTLTRNADQLRELASRQGGKNYHNPWWYH